MPFWSQSIWTRVGTLTLQQAQALLILNAPPLPLKMFVFWCVAWCYNYNALIVLWKHGVYDVVFFALGPTILDADIYRLCDTVVPYACHVGPSMSKLFSSEFPRILMSFALCWRRCWVLMGKLTKNACSRALQTDWVCLSFLLCVWAWSPSLNSVPLKRSQRNKKQKLTIGHAPKVCMTACPMTPRHAKPWRQ